MQTKARAKATPIEPTPRKDDLPGDFGHHTRRCRRCNSWICRWHEALSGLCWPCEPGGEGIVLQVAPGDYRRFTPADLLEKAEPSYEALMSES